jgi:hypothetical protein
VAVATTAQAAETNKLPMFQTVSRTSQYALRILYCVLFFFLSSCGATITPTPFIAPRGPTLPPTVVEDIALFTPTPEISLPLPTDAATETPPTPIEALPTLTLNVGALVSPTSEPVTEQPTQTPGDCKDSLKYIQDLNYPDDSAVSAGQAIQKQWQVENDGSCDWDANYRLKLLDGTAALGAANEQALFPARAGTQATISINFTAPTEAGTYRTAWQAYNSAGIAFGETIYMQIVVGP